MRSAMTYPLIVSVFSVAVIIFIMVYVVPQFEKIYEDQGAPVTGNY